MELARGTKNRPFQAEVISTYQKGWELARSKRLPQFIAIPNKEPYYYSQGVGTGVNCVLVRVETDEGIVGIGEGCGDRSAEAVAT